MGPRGRRRGYHSEQIAEHGGGAGIRDMGLLQSALARPQNAYHYNQVVSLSKMAACYAFGIAKNHAFVDGNKRTAYVVMRAFLVLNGFDINATREEKYLTFYALAEVLGAAGGLQLTWDWKVSCIRWRDAIPCASRPVISSPYASGACSCSFLR